MDTKWITDLETQSGVKSIVRAGEIIRQGGLVAFPTETVYGLGGDALNADSAKKIYEAKGRPSDNPLIVHIAKWEDLEKIVAEIPDYAVRLAEKYWPGPLTMIFKKSNLVPYETTGGLETVAVRIPDHEIALQFIEAAGGFVAAPSANASGRPSPTLAKYVFEDMNGKIDMLLDGGQVGIGIESTIVDLTEEIPMILRPGYVTQQMLEAVIGKVDLDKTIMSNQSGLAPKAPGMRYRHYAPKAELTIIAGEKEAVAKKINELTAEKQKQKLRVGVIATDESVALYLADLKKSVGSRFDENEIAHRLYQILREFDEEEVDCIYSESFSATGMGQAIMNRLIKAAGHKIVTMGDDSL